jgi:hypothetical protein
MKVNQATEKRSVDRDKNPKETIQDTYVNLSHSPIRESLACVPA